LAHIYLGQAYLCIGQYEEAIERMERALPPDNDGSAAILAMLGYAYGAAGKNRSARQMFRRLEDVAKRSYVSPYDRAVLHVGLGEIEEALRCLQQAMDERAPRVIWLGVEPVFDRMRGNREFEDLVLRLGLT
jgi:tetratricopeptide (TPR) repeat protein